MPPFTAITLSATGGTDDAGSIQRGMTELNKFTSLSPRRRVARSFHRRGARLATCAAPAARQRVNSSANRAAPTQRAEVAEIAEWHLDAGSARTKHGCVEQRCLRDRPDVPPEPGRDRLARARRRANGRDSIAEARVPMDEKQEHRGLCCGVDIRREQTQAESDHSVARRDILSLPLHKQLLARHATRAD